MAEVKKPEVIKNDPNELVEIKLFKDNGKYSSPLFVSVNGETVAIERGVRLQVKRKFVEVIENSERQDYETSLKIAKATEVKKIADL